tara:strand:- start:1165 stop:3717 length:2553 start_codon:yes stop_codon:yes gene_type:complete
MAVNLGKRNINTGVHGNRKAQGVPTRQNVASVKPGQDPGVAGGPNLPANYYGDSGSVGTGRNLQNVANDVLSDQRAVEVQAMKTRLQAEEVEIGIILAETKLEFDHLSANVGDTTAAFSQEGAPLTDVQGEGIPLSGFDIYRKKSQDVVDKKIAALDKKNFSQGSKEKLAQQLQGNIRIHNAAVGKSVMTLKQKEYADFVGRSYKSSAERHPGDLNATLAENSDIFRDTRLLLGDTEAISQLQTNNEAAALSLYDEHFDEGRFDQAQAALDGSVAKLFISPETRRTKIADVRKARTAAFIKDESAANDKSKLKEGIIDGGDGFQYQLVQGDDGTVKATKIPGLPGQPIDFTKNVVETKNGGRVHITMDSSGVVTAKPIPGFPTVDDLTKNTITLKNGTVVKLFKTPEGKLKSTPIGGTEQAPEEVERSKGLIKLVEQQIKDGTITFKTEEDKNKFFKSLFPTTAPIAAVGAEKGRLEAEEKQAKTDRLKELGYRDVFEVDDGVTNSISSLVDKGLGSVSKGGVLTRVEGAEKLSPTLVAMAEDALVSGKARTIGQAVKMAFERFVDEGGELPKIVTGASIVKALKEAAAKPSLEQRLKSQDIRKGVIEKFADNALTKADLQDSLDRLEAIDFGKIEEESKIDFKDAMGVRSSLVQLIGKTVAQIPGLGHLENAEVTKARLMFALVARDVVRMISLSPRFAVKEQELIQSIFGGPAWWDSPLQARNKVDTMLGIIDDRMERIEDRLALSGIDPTQESDLIDEADRLLEIQGRMNKFEFNIIKIDTVEQANALTAVQVGAHMKTLSKTDIQNMPGNIAIALDDILQGKSIKPKRKAVTKTKPKTKPKPKKTK